MRAAKGTKRTTVRVTAAQTIRKTQEVQVFGFGVQVKGGSWVAGVLQCFFLVWLSVL